MIILIIIISIFSVSQTPHEIKYDLSASINVFLMYITIRNAGSAWTDFKTGPTFGMFSKMSVAKYFALPTELNYSLLD